jgi:peptidyl-prolyl cis-trans isomerase C
MAFAPAPRSSARPRLLAGLALAALLAASGPVLAADAAPAVTPASDDPVVATVNGKTFHKSDVVDLQRQLPQELQSVPLEQIYLKLVDQLVDRELLTEAAAKANIANDPEVKKRLADLRPRIEMQVYIEKLAAQGVTSDKLHTLYDKMAAGQKAVPEIHARHILVGSESDANDIIAQLDKGGDFAKIANEKSLDKGEDGGDLGWFTADKMVPEFSAAAFKLKKGEYTHTPVKSQFGWHVIQVLDTREMPPPAFDSVKEQLSQQLQGEAISAKIEDLRAKAKYQEFKPDGTPMTPPPTQPN